ncbi:NADH dehydrogenase [ubiquinone] 1 alpha subcomplex subunit 11-like [Pecten maximus]|uniref:NADH dehydrogenase [ubiquinone] 1 alpha subcomplex subunit 11-like n=1 Tax=Pecten maximus TaxID=6579 RepID=UPI001458D1E4|nr:NADH dehydrogenase [ubiquinone] 1 alpha subcomplex subunit 11-like [Pecten maximus]
MEGEEKQSEKTEEIHDIKSFILRKQWLTGWHTIWSIPDGQQTEKKAVTACSIAAGAGIAAGFARSCLGPAGIVKSSASIVPKLGVYGFVIAPNIVAAATYVYATSYAADIRGKSDEINHFVGGAAAGAVFGLKNLSLFQVAKKGVGLGVVALMISELATKPAFESLRREAQVKPFYVFGRRSNIPSNIEHK